MCLFKMLRLHLHSLRMSPFPLTLCHHSILCFRMYYFPQRWFELSGATEQNVMRGCCWTTAVQQILSVRAFALSWVCPYAMRSPRRSQVSTVNLLIVHGLIISQFKQQKFKSQKFIQQQVYLRRLFF